MDLIYTCTDIEDERQYFWEAFPAELDKNSVDGKKSNVRTTYMFSYLDANQKDLGRFEFWTITGT